MSDRRRNRRTQGTAAGVACGSRHTAVLTRAGGVLCFGWNGHGQLGTGDTEQRDEPAAAVLPGALPAAPVNRAAGARLPLRGIQPPQAPRRAAPHERRKPADSPTLWHQQHGQRRTDGVLLCFPLNHAGGWAAGRAAAVGVACGLWSTMVWRAA